MQNPAVKWTIFIVGIVATVVAVVLITIYARRELKKHLGPETDASGNAVTDAGASTGAASPKQSTYKPPAAGAPETA